MKLKLAAMVAAFGVLATPAFAQNKVKIGLITTLSGPQAGPGLDILDGFMLAHRACRRQARRRDAEVINGDDQLKPDVGSQLADRMVKRDKVDIVTGVIFSNILLAVFGPVLTDRRGKIMISSNAGPSSSPASSATRISSQPPGRTTRCTRRSASTCTAGVKKVYMMAPNYPAGKDALAGFKRFYKGEVAARSTRSSASPTTRPRSPDPRRQARRRLHLLSRRHRHRVRQAVAQAGLAERYRSSALVHARRDHPAGDRRGGARRLRRRPSGRPDLENPRQQEVRRGFEAKYNRIPSLYAAQGYDAALLIDSAVKAGGKRRHREEGQFAPRCARPISTRCAAPSSSTTTTSRSRTSTCEIVKDDEGPARHGPERRGLRRPRRRLRHRMQDEVVQPARRGNPLRPLLRVREGASASERARCGARAEPQPQPCRRVARWRWSPPSPQLRGGEGGFATYDPSRHDRPALPRAGPQRPAARRAAVPDRGRPDARVRHHELGESRARLALHDGRLFRRDARAD